MARTEGEINELKRQWLADPCWDIYETEGFEAHRIQLRAYQTEVESRWEAARTEEYHTKAAEIGCPGNVKLAAYVLRLESQIDNLTRLLDDMRS